jgi:N-acetyl-D-muramate 6-phosphate phosphatase
MSPSYEKQATVLFDLDGTLVDTAVDLGLALNIQLERHQQKTLSHNVIWPVASHGARGLLALGFGITTESPNYEEMRNEYLDIYETVFTRQPTFLAGIEKLLYALDDKSICWGIVTNKPRRFSVDLIKAVPYRESNLYTHAACLVCGDDTTQPKPSPQTLLMACQKIDVLPKDCVYVGDAERDVIAGKAAGMKTVIAMFGYIGSNDTPHLWGADAMIASPEALLTLLNL